MKITILSICAFILCTYSYAQLPVKPLAPQKKLLESKDKKLAANKKLVYDMWREFLEGGHLELSEKYFTENYMQHDPVTPTGRKGELETLWYFTPQPIVDTIKAKVVSITAEGDLVTMAFVSERSEKNDKTKKYTTTSFEMYRIENGKIAEHWNNTTK